MNRLVKILRVYREAFTGYTPKIALLGLLGFASGLLEAIGINLLIPIFAILTNSPAFGDVVTPRVKAIFDFVGTEISITYLLVIMSVLFIIKAAIQFYGKYVQMIITAKYEKTLRMQILERHIKADWPYLITQKIGYLDTILTSQISAGSNLLQGIGTFALVVTSLLIYIVTAVSISFSVTLLTVLFGAILFAIFQPFVAKTRTISREQVNLNKDASHFVNEITIGGKTVKALGIYEPIVARGEEFFGRLQKIKTRLVLNKTIAVTFIQPISLIFIVLLFAFSYKLASFNVASFIVVMYLVQKIFAYIQHLQAGLHGLSESLPSLESALKQKQLAEAHEEALGGTKPFVFEKTLEFKDVKFSYTERKDFLNIAAGRFVLKKGSMVGIIGPSGAGKTTVVDLILRLLKPQSGKIMLDDTDISEIKMSEWRKSVGYVSQDIFLMNDTFMNNIRFYEPAVTDEMVIEAAKMAQIHGFIEKSEKGYETVVGERGLLLSGGQRQRIAIARILARSPKLLVLDEATSSLDNESELEVQKAIENLKGKVTVLTIAHRLSTVMNCDYLISLKDGLVENKGVPAELLQDKDSYFYKVYKIRQ